MRYQDFLEMTTLKSYAAAINNRALQYQTQGIVTAEMLRSIILESGGACGWCSKRLVDIEFEIDHIFSLSQHGQNTEDNLVVACPECNRSKGEKNPLKFALEIVAHTGSKSLLVDRLLSQSQTDAYVQQKLFDENVSAKMLDYPKIQIDSENTRSLPPYNWSKT